MSGYDYTFACEVPKEFSCPICECPMREPVQTKCGHRFCKECLQKSLKRKRKCPIDRGHLNERSKTDIYPDVAVERAILDLIVKCPNESNGCKWTGELRIVKTHEAVCDFIGVKCTNKGCKVTPLKKDLLKHVTDECPKRKVQCSYCNTPFVWCLRQGHFDVCGKYPVCCVQNCGEQKIPRDQMSGHIELSCGVTEVDCTFAHIGCDVKVQRRAIADHVKENTENHLKLACEKLQEFEVLSTVNTANVKELEAEMVTAKKKIAELSEAVIETNGLQGLINNKIALTNEKLNELSEKDEVDELIEEVKNLQDEKLLEVQDELGGLQILSTVNAANVKELEAEMVTAKKKIAELSEAVKKTNGLQGMIYNKIALTDEKLNELPEKDEVDSLIGEVKDLQHEKFLEVQDEVSELRIFVNEELQSLKTAIFKLRDQRQSDRQENSFLGFQIAHVREETRTDKILLHECRDKLTAHQEWWRKAKFVLFCIFFLVVFLLLSLQSHN